MKKRTYGFSSAAYLAGIAVFILSGCVEEYAFIADTPVSEIGDKLPPPNSDICDIDPNAEACKRDPVVQTPGTVTILFTVSQIPQGSASLIMANAIKYASPKKNPKILFMKDSHTNGEDEGDSPYIKNVLLAGYDVEYKELVSPGLSLSELAGYDLAILSNPGHPFSDEQTLNSLKAFKGGVILVGDDMAAGRGFSPESLTGLKLKNNGTSMSCDGKSYKYDNLAGYFYQISMNTEFLPGIPVQYQKYEYGNDIDWTSPHSGVQVLAWASAAPGTCDIGLIPAVVRKPK